MLIALLKYFVSLTGNQNFPRMQIDDFLIISFVNKRAQQYRKNMITRDLRNLFNLFQGNQNIRQRINGKFQLKNLSQQEEFKKVANQVQFLGYDNEYCMIFGIYGPNIERSNYEYLIFTLQKLIQQSCFNVSRTLNQSVNITKHKTSGVSFVFFNNTNKKGLNKKSNKNILQSIKIDDFKDQIIKNLKFRHLSRINHIILVFPSFVNKSWGYLSSFGFIDGFYNKFFTNVDSIVELVNFLGPLFDYQKLNKSIFNRYECQISKLSLYSNQQIAQSRQQLHFQQQFQPTLQSGEDNYFVYHKKISDYLKHPQKEIPLLLLICFQQIQKNYLKYQGLFRKVADQNELRKLQNKLLSYQHDVRNKKLDQKQLVRLQQNVRSQLKLFCPQTITSFIKKIFTQLKDPIFSNDVYTQIISMRWNDLQYQLRNYQPLKKEINQHFGEKNPIKSSQTQSFGQQITKDNVKQKVAFFENLSQPNFTISNSTNNLINSSQICNQSLNNKNTIRFRKIPYLPSKIFQQQKQKHKNNGFLKLHELKINSSQQFCLLRETIRLLNKVTRQQKFNLMSTKNLAICFNPCFFKCPKSSNHKITSSVQQQYENQGKLVRVIQRMIEKPDCFFETD